MSLLCLPPLWNIRIPREYRLGSINAVLNVYTRVSDLLSNPYDQVREQLRLLTAEPAFAFLADARPLFSTSPTIPGPVPAAGLPDNSASGAPVAEPKDLNAPQLPGTVTHAPDYRAPASYDPQKQPRPLDSFDAVPVVVPGDDQPELPGDLVFRQPPLM